MVYFATPEELLDEFYAVMKAHPDWVAKVDTREHVRIQVPEEVREEVNLNCLCPIEAIQLHHRLKVGVFSGDEIASTECSNRIIAAADFSSSTIRYTWQEDREKMTHTLHLHDRLVRMTKEFETRRDFP